MEVVASLADLAVVEDLSLVSREPPMVLDKPNATNELWVFVVVDVVAFADRSRLSWVLGLPTDADATHQEAVVAP